MNTGSFLTPAHLETLRNLLQKYIEQNRQLVLPESYWTSGAITDMLQQAIHQTLMDVKQGKLPGDFTQMNKRVLSLCIPLVVKMNAISSPSSTSTVTPSPRKLPSSDSSLNLTEGSVSGNGIGYSEYVDMSPEEVSVDKDRAFMEKLQELELTRSLPVTQPSGSVGGGGSGIANPTPGSNEYSSVNVKSTADVLLPQTLSANIPTSISTVFMPMPPRKGNELLINSWQRNWLQYPHRNGYMWNGPLPHGIDLTASRIAGILLPRKFLKKSPYMVLHLEGAGNNTYQAILIPDASSTSSECPWLVYRPMNEDLGYMKSIACPWIIKLYTANGMMLVIGKDGERVMLQSNERIEMSLDVIRTLEVEDQLWVFGPNGDIFWCEVTHIQKETAPYWVAYQSDEPPKFLGEGNLFNFSQQWSILLNLQKTPINRN